MLLKSGPDAPKLEKMVLYLSQDGHTDKQRSVQTDAQIDQKIKNMFRNFTLHTSPFFEVRRRLMSKKLNITSTI